MATNNAINLSAAGVTYYNGAGTFSGITGATTGTILQNNTGSAPTYSTATYPSTTTINQLLYSSAANTITGLAVGTSGQVLTTNGSGVPTWATIATGVSSVTGTTNQILASPTTGAVVLSLIGPYTPATYTAHGVLVGEGTSSIVAVGPTATAGQVLQSAGASADPAFSTATYPLTTTINQLLYSSAANTITGLAVGTSGQILTTNGSGVPTWATLATGVSSVTGTANQISASPTTGAVVLSLIGPYTPATYTAHGVLVGEGTSSIVAVGPTATAGQVLQSAGSSADPAFSTATYPLTTTINQLLYSSAANTITGLAVGTSGQVLTTNASGVPTWTTIQAVMSWTVITANQAAVAGHGYIANSATTAIVTLPSTSAPGDTIAVTGINNATGWQVAQPNAASQIFYGTSSTTLGVTSGSTGTLTSSATRDTVYLVCVTANATWNVVNTIGNLTVA